jgi:hypothetical protein
MAVIIGAMIVFAAVFAAGFGLTLSDHGRLGDAFFLLGAALAFLFAWGSRRGWFR